VARNRPGPRRSLRFALGVAAWTVVSAGCGMGLGATLRIVQLREHAPERTALQARNQRRTGRPPTKSWLDLGAMDPDVKHAVLVSEDIRFFDHRGFDFHELKVALREAYESGEPPRGASTLTQQLAKNLYLTADRSLVRKLVEAFYTVVMETLLSKERILEIYLNEVEFGPQVYGVDAAARHHFGRSAQDLSPEQAAQLAALLPAPYRDHPRSGREIYVARWNRILDRMASTADFRARIP
jgi:monofunctional glycosyltransferase